MRLSAHDEARLLGLETVVTDFRAELDKFLDFKESCWRNIGVREQEVPGWSHAQGFWGPFPGCLSMSTRPRAGQATRQAEQPPKATAIREGQGTPGDG